MPSTSSDAVDPILGTIDPLAEVDEAVRSPGEIRRLAASGAVLVAFRGVALQILGALSNIVLARLLTPHDFGLVALGETVLFFGSIMATTGVGSALVRQVRPPTDAQLSAVAGFQLVVTLAITAGTVILVAPLGRAGEVAAIMSASLPFLAIRSPAGIVLERDLQYRPLVFVEVTETLLYYVWAITAVVLGFGVWGLATAAVARTTVGTLTLARLSPVGLVRPRLSWTVLRPILSFGAKVQGSSTLNLVRDQGLSLAIAAIGGVSTLGLWGLTYRVLAPASLLFQAVQRVSFPAMSRLLALGEDVRPTLQRTVAVVSVATGMLLTPLVGAAPALVPSVFGARWADAAHGLPPAAFGLLIVVPVSVGVGGYLVAAGEPGTMLRGASLHTIAQFAVALPLLKVLGIWALGLGVAASSIVEATVLGRKTTRMTGTRILSGVVPSLLAAVAAGGLGWGIAVNARPTLPVAVGTAAAAEILFLAIIATVSRAALLETFRLLRVALRASASR